MHTAKRILPLLLLSLLLAACAGNRAGGGGARPAEEATTVRVQNQAWLDMTMYVVEGGQRIRLGLVTSNSTATFRIPQSVVGLGRNVSFLADPVGRSATARSFDIFVRPGETLTLTIPPAAG